MPGKEELRATLLATFQAPLQQFVALLQAPAQNLVYLLGAKERKGKSSVSAVRQDSESRLQAGPSDAFKIRRIGHGRDYA